MLTKKLENLRNTLEGGGNSNQNNVSLRMSSNEKTEFVNADSDLDVRFSSENVVN